MDNRTPLFLTRPPQRVVSLVPSITESLFDLGFGRYVVGITDYCIHPAEFLQDVKRVGGTKTPRINDILTVKPDLIIANQEENNRSVIEALEAAGFPVWVTFPQTVRQALSDLWTLTRLFQNRTALIRLETLERTLDWAESAAATRASISYFCPIWYGNTETGEPWWMTFNQSTYAHDLLRTLGGENVFASRERRYPLEADLGTQPAQDSGERDKRYPRVSLNEILAADPELILLPDEPFPFDHRHRDYLLDILIGTRVVEGGKIYLVDGSLITWHGTRLGRALQELPGYFG